jgi:hypothetical protein
VFVYFGIVHIEWGGVFVGQSKAKKEEQKVIKYGPTGVGRDEHVFGIAHIYASFNDTFVVLGLGEWMYFIHCF